jgi:hypothetical protein
MKFQIFYREGEERDLLLMWNAVLIPHMVIDSVVTNIFLFQIAMLAVSMSI